MSKNITNKNLLYSENNGLIIGFHGCDKKTFDSVLNGKDELISKYKSYHWLGQGVYFWENNVERAYLWAEECARTRSPGFPKIKTPAVLGAVISLGLCLDLNNSMYLEMLKASYETYKELILIAEDDMPINSSFYNRKLDCAVIDFLHKYRSDNGKVSFDSVRSSFIEGGELFPNSGFFDKSHVQICIRNPNCIKAYFKPRDFNIRYNFV